MIPLGPPPPTVNCCRVSESVSQGRAYKISLLGPNFLGAGQGMMSFLKDGENKTRGDNARLVRSPREQREMERAKTQTTNAKYKDAGCGGVLLRRPRSLFSQSAVVG